MVLDSLYKHKQKADSYVPVAPRREASTEAESLVSFDGKDYVSASRAAELTGYHRDYVAQLGRAGTILSRQVGNRWFVDRASLLAHKATKDRLLGAVQSQAVGLPEKKDEEVVLPESLSNASYSVAGPLLKYSSDERELLPITTDHPNRIADAPTSSDAGLDPPQLPKNVRQVNLGVPRRENLGIPSRVSTPLHVRVLHPISEGQRKLNLRMPSNAPRGGGLQRRSLKRLRVGALATGVATIVIFLSLGLVSFRNEAIYARIDPAMPTMSALSANAAWFLDHWANYLESVFVPSLTYRRDR